MHMNQFSKWVKWENRNKLNNIKFPSIYIIAISAKNLEGKKFNWIQEINYIGMTNSVAGLKGRLKQFDNTIMGKIGHGGADRFRYEYNNYDNLVKNLYVSIRYFECDVKSNKPKDLKIMGKVAKFEYDCFAEYVQKFKLLPKFNDKKNSPKYSLTYKKIKNG